MSDSKKELTAELRRLADYANGIASGTATGTEEADVGAAVWFHRDQPDGDLYTALHAQIVAVCPAKIVDELEQLHANTIAAHRKVVEHDGGITCYWVNQKGKAVEQSSVPMKNGRITDGYKVVTEISEDYKCECHALAVAARNEANFIDAVTLDAGKAQEASNTYRKYPQDAEALALLEAAAKLKAKLAKRNPKIENKEVIQSLLDEPDGSETKKQKDQRLKYQYRVWYGAVKNGKRQNATATPPKQLDAKTKAATWEKIYNDWGKHLSCYMKHPPAK